MIRFGVIGTADIARRSFAPVLTTSDETVLVAVASRTQEKADVFASQFGCEGIEGYRNLLKRPDIDAVYIATPTGLHAEWAIAAARAGKHILCEKTLARNVYETQAILQTCREENVAIMEGFAYQFHPQHRALDEWVTADKIGEAVQLQAWFGFPPIDSPHRYTPELGGGALLDAGTYTVHVARRFFKSEPINVSSVLDSEGESVDIRGSALLDFGAQRTALLSFGFNNMYRNEYTVWGTTGLITIARAFSIPPTMSATLVLNRQDEHVERKLDPFDHFRGELDHFCAGFLSEAKRSHWRQDALHQAITLEAIRQSSAGRTTIRPSFP
jgi:predicted dehydrogenase